MVISCDDCVMSTRRPAPTASSRTCWVPTGRRARRRGGARRAPARAGRPRPVLPPPGGVLMRAVAGRRRARADPYAGAVRRPAPVPSLDELARDRPASTGSSTSAWPRRRCSSGPAPPSTIAATAGLAAGWGSRTATLTARPIHRGRCPGPARSWSPPARTSTESDPPRPAGCAGTGRPVRVGRPLRTRCGPG